MADKTALAKNIIQAVGGASNISAATHCMTRLRLVLKDEGLADTAAIEKFEGVIAVVRAGGQIQIVIGPLVDTVYDEVCRLGNLEAQEAVTSDGAAPEVTAASDTADGKKPKQKWSFKRLADNVMGTLSACIVPILPVFMVAGIFNMLSVLLAPGYIGILPEDSDLMKLFNLVTDAGYYFLPFSAAYSAAKYFKSNPVLGFLMAGIMIHPDMLGIVESGEPFTVYGIPMWEVNYTQAVIPMILVVWAMAHIESFLKKHVPKILRTLGVPVLTIAISLPIGLCLLGPICYMIMNVVSSFIIWISDTVGIVAIVVVTVLWPFVIMFGMHVPILTAMLPVQMQLGYDTILYPAQFSGVFSKMAVYLAYGLRSKGSDNKALGLECFSLQTFANVGEPGLYGVLLRDRRAFAWWAIGAAVGSVVLYLLGADAYIFSGVGFPFLNPLRFGPDIVPGTIGLCVSALTTFVLSMIFGFEGATGRPQFIKKKDTDAEAGTAAA